MGAPDKIIELMNGFHEQYDDQWETISSIFSRDAILKESFDKYAESEASDAFWLPDRN